MVTCRKRTFEGVRRAKNKKGRNSRKAKTDIRHKTVLIPGCGDTDGSDPPFLME